MSIRLNGEHIELPDSIKTIEDLLQHFHLQNKMMIVEQNREIIDQKAFKLKKLNNDDHIEIVHFVGGG
ncbi:sulfur carrier protein [Scopulibacillus darangshiensis]|uniref:Sulfur carrier protein n=1 Tax=Scopulibacillus darangshiensis TaxID=442528 RepID=A0A4R2PAG9_9BACL|nr:sulfur carrier protein ThiS [Scopulibacillus darangshiensis]TCP32069.1 sulfur carrier protein [Scopulibacillus darangshiensis]